MKTKKEKVFKEGCTYVLKEKYAKISDEFDHTYRNDWSCHWEKYSLYEPFKIEITGLLGACITVHEDNPVDQHHRKYYKRVK